MTHLGHQGTTWLAEIFVSFTCPNIACRPANQPTAIHPSLQIGIPAFISDKEDQFQLYFVTVTPIAQVLTAPAKLQVGQ